jgi:hypothetical protein
MESNFKQTGVYFGIVNGLIALIPPIPIFSLYPGSALSDFVKAHTNSYFLPYRYYLVIFITLSVGVAIVFCTRLYQLDFQNKSAYKKIFRIFSFMEYVFINNLMIIFILGPDDYMSGRPTQVVFMAFVSSVISSISLVFLGLISDVFLMVKESAA